MLRFVRTSPTVSEPEKVAKRVFSIPSNQNVTILPGRSAKIRSGLLFNIPAPIFGKVFSIPFLFTHFGLRASRRKFYFSDSRELSFTITNRSKDTQLIKKGQHVAHLFIDTNCIIPPSEYFLLEIDNSASIPLTAIKNNWS
jgi:dUTPase